MENALTYKAKFTWAIEHFSKLTIKKCYSSIFPVGGHKWRLLMHPKGNNVDHLSIYLDVADSATLPSGWSREAFFNLSVVSQNRPLLTINKKTIHTFNAEDSDWGFTKFIPLLDVYDTKKGYLVDDILIVEAEVSAERVIDDQADDYRKQTGFVGLKNQLATGQRKEVSPSHSSQVVADKVGERVILVIHSQNSDETNPPESLEKHKGVEGGGDGEAHNIQHSRVLPEALRGAPCRSMTEKQIEMVLGDITRGLVPTDLEDPRWPSSAGEMAQTFASVVRLADEFKAMKEEVERQSTRAATLSEAMELLIQEGRAKP